MSLAVTTPINPRSLLITGELDRRPPRAVDLVAEVAAMHRITGIVAANPDDAIGRFLEIALGLCDAGSVGLSVLGETPSGEKVFRWDAIRGAYARHVGGSTPADFSPCGVCLAEGRPTLMEHPELAFPYLEGVSPVIVETLGVPLYDTGRVPLGVLWIVSHEEGRRFDGETARQMEQLASLLVLAIRLKLKDLRLSGMLGALEGRARDRARLRQAPV